MKKQEDIRNMLIRLKASDHAAFSDIFMMWHQQVYLFCCKSLSKEDAEEIVQNVFMIVWENRHQIDLQYSFSSYLFSIAKHQVYNIIRNKLTQKVFIERYLQQFESVEMEQEFDDSIDMMKAKLKKIVEQFPDRQREIYKMSRTYHMTYREIAKKLGISENTVDTSIRRSLAVLRNAFMKLALLFFWFK